MGAGGAGVFEDANPREPSSRRFKAVAAVAPLGAGAAARRARVARRPRLGAAPPRHGRRVAGRPGERLLGRGAGRYVSFARGAQRHRGRAGAAAGPGARAPRRRRCAARRRSRPSFYSAYLGFAAARGRAGTLRSRVLPCRGEPPAVTVAVGGAGSVKAALLDVRGDAAGYSMAESSPILADAADATLAWSATATRVPELPESCVLVLELADATVFTFVPRRRRRRGR
ncbi:hypothetical protein JL722_4570 [Aureococcus anophagefferens]|nr:hypothetical protein JL722_4570 [Aureococcus anophagefferens]